MSISIPFTKAFNRIPKFWAAFIQFYFLSTTDVSENWISHEYIHNVIIIHKIIWFNSSDKKVFKGINLKIVK